MEIVWLIVCSTPPRVYKKAATKRVLRRPYQIEAGAAITAEITEPMLARDVHGKIRAGINSLRGDDTY